MSAGNGPDPAAGAGTIDKFPIPGVSQRGAAGDAAPDSVLGRMRAAHHEQQAREELTLALPPFAGYDRRVRYGYVSLDDMDQTDTAGLSEMDATLKMLARAVKAIEVRDPETDRWEVLEDDLGPVSFDDRYARLMRWERPGVDGGEDYVYNERQVYEAIFNGNGLAIGTHIARVTRFMGGGEEDLTELLGGLAPGSTTPAPPSRSG
jgi:hypothetical protein